MQFPAKKTGQKPGCLPGHKVALLQPDVFLAANLTLRLFCGTLFLGIPAILTFRQAFQPFLAAMSAAYRAI